jgi:hypothetical protein
VKQRTAIRCKAYHCRAVPRKRQKRKREMKMSGPSVLLPQTFSHDSWQQLYGVASNQISSTTQINPSIGESYSSYHYALTKRQTVRQIYGFHIITILLIIYIVRIILLIY